MVAGHRALGWRSARCPRLRLSNAVVGWFSMLAAAGYLLFAKACGLTGCSPTGSCRAAAR
jgi:hypothetical protein